MLARTALAGCSLPPPIFSTSVYKCPTLCLRVRRVAYGYRVGKKPRPAAAVVGCPVSREDKPADRAALSQSIVPPVSMDGMMGNSSSAVSGAVCDIDTGDTAWMLFATTFVMLQTPATGLAQAGLVRRKNALSLIAQAFIGVLVGSFLVRVPPCCCCGSVACRSYRSAHRTVVCHWVLAHLWALARRIDRVSGRHVPVSLPSPTPQIWLLLPWVHAVCQLPRLCIPQWCRHGLPAPSCNAHPWRSLCILPDDVCAHGTCTRYGSLGRKVSDGRFPLLRGECNVVIAVVRLAYVDLMPGNLTRRRHGD
jgi:hypothetical protein